LAFIEPLMLLQLLPHTQHESQPPLTVVWKWSRVIVMQGIVSTYRLANNES
jgi:hypothetical protein